MKISTVLLTILTVVNAHAQQEVELSALTVKQFGEEYTPDHVIGGLDYTQTTSNYVSDSTRFYLNDVLFSGVASISNAWQESSFHFESGRLHGLWYDVIWSNSNLWHQGYYDNGVKQGWWFEGTVHLQQDSIASVSATLFEEEVYRKSFYKQGELTLERYTGRDWTSGLTEIDGYREITFANGRAQDVHRYYDAESFRGEKNSGPKNGMETYWLDADSVSKVILHFDDGYLRLKETFRQNTLIQSEEYLVQDLNYNVVRFEYHPNGMLKSRGLILSEYDVKSGEWLYYREDGSLFKKEVYPQGDVFAPPWTTLFHKDGTAVQKK